MIVLMCGCVDWSCVVAWLCGRAVVSRSVRVCGVVCVGNMADDVGDVVVGVVCCECVCGVPCVVSCWSVCVCVSVAVEVCACWCVLCVRFVVVCCGCFSSV